MKKKSLLLNEKWDIHLDRGGNIAETTGLYCDAQNIANAVRLFTNDAYLAKDKGIPHFIVDLGVRPLDSQVRHLYRLAALGVENIAEAKVYIDGIDEDRVYKGTIKAVTDAGEDLALDL